MILNKTQIGRKNEILHEMLFGYSPKHHPRKSTKLNKRAFSQDASIVKVDK